MPEPNMSKCTVDADLCCGHGRCADVAPDFFGVDEDGFTTLRGKTRDVPGNLLAQVEEAILGCPSVAIKWVEDNE